ncbi:MAG: hypothetical protein JNK15_17570 [Planctomycetes bacterium]|nr:hypothetical protein [Planctomycetota bacterium]
MNATSTAATAWAWRGLWAAALGIGAWLAVNACYRADDFGLLREAWADGDFGAALAHWWRLHVEPRDPGAWPKFYRPAWHATFLVDAHLFGATAAWSAALSWSLHVANVGLVAMLTRRFVGTGIWPLFAAFLCLLPGAAMQAPTWIAARCQVLATTGTLAAIAFATATNLRPGPRAVGTTVAVLVAAGAHDFGATAGLLAAFAAWVQSRGSTTRTAWPATIALPTVLAVAWLAWRASRLGVWIGGYEASGNVAPFRLLDTLATGMGALVLPGDGTLSFGLTAGVGTAALLALCVASLLPHRRRAAAGIAAATILLSLAPAVGNSFRGSELVNGRYLYTAHCAWVLGLAALLSVCESGRGRRLAHGLAVIAGGATTAGFVSVTHGLQHTFDTTRAVFAAIDELPATPTVLLGLPDADGPHLIGRNALPAALGPPFRRMQPHVLGWATEFDLQHGFVLGVATVFDAAPDAAARHWNGPTRTFVAVHPDPPPLSTSPSTRPQLLPPVAPNDATWTFRGSPGDGVVLLAGDVACELDLGAAGRLGVAKAQRLPIGVADAAGALRFQLPATALAARRLQAVAIRGFGPSMHLSNLHEPAAGSGR